MIPALMKFLPSQGHAAASLSAARLGGYAGARGVRSKAAELLAVAGGALFVSVAAVLASIVLYFAIAATAGN